MTLPSRPQIAVCLAAEVLIGAAWLRNRAQLEIEISASKLQQEKVQVASMRERIERLFQLAYQTNRTISLLPGVRAIQGGNRSNDKVDVVAQGRLGSETHATIQQLYNNLAANESVSEVYCVLAGLDASRGEVPFLMYDEVRVSGEAAEPADAEPAAESKGPDVPEELESAEYQEYPLQVEYFRKISPHFGFDSLDKIPAVSSPPMRTCDNTQYLSRSSGDSANATGLLYSTPFYSLDGNLKGLISSVVRANVLEAMLCCDGPSW